MSEESATDTAVDLKKRARRRLVGAIALALLAIIVLPIVMDSEPRPAGPEIQVVIPSQDGNSVSTRPRPGPSVSTSAGVPSGLKGDGAFAQVVSSTSVSPAPTPVRSVPGVAPAAEKAPNLAVGTGQSFEKPKTEMASGKSEAPAKSDTAKALAALEGKDADQWYVLLGAYQNAGNVKQLSAKLKEMGLPVFTEKADSSQGARTRVRSGPFKSREAAEKARVRIKKIGVDGQVAQK